MTRMFLLLALALPAHGSPALLAATRAGIAVGEAAATGSQRSGTHRRGKSRTSASSTSATTTSATSPSATSPSGPHAASAIKNVFWQPNEVQQGSVVFFTVELERPASRVSATWLGKSLSFFKTDDPAVWYSLAGADLETPPASSTLQVTATLRGGKIERSTKNIEVAAGSFKTGAIDVPENFVEPDAAGKKQIAADELLKNRAYAHLSPAPQWSGNFIAPVAAKPTDSFGETRILNEERTSMHRGTDFPVPEGTPVVASNSGTVVLARDLFYEGGCIIVDHGQKLFTIYMHLSKFGVAVGDKVEKGAKLGVSGKTGRVTGPHLHMGVRWNGAYLDPTRLLAVTLPKVQLETPPRRSRR